MLTHTCYTFFYTAISTKKLPKDEAFCACAEGETPLFAPAKTPFILFAYKL